MPPKKKKFRDRVEKIAATIIHPRLDPKARRGKNPHWTTA
jgi:hypothetical protein